MREISIREAVEAIEEGKDVIVQTKDGGFAPSSDAYFKLSTIASAKFFIVEGRIIVDK